MTRRRITIAAVVVAAVSIGIYLSAPPALVEAATTPEIPDDFESYLATGERLVDDRFGLVPGTEKRVLWREPGVRTEYVVIYLHGFSATRQETAPLAERVAEALNANLFETRLSGHGHAELPMHEVRAEDWMHDAIEAISVGARLGDNIIVIGTSTGGTLALAIAEHELAASVSDIILISPNLQPADTRSNWLTRPLGPLLARIITGDTRSWTAHNEQQERYWSTSYPTAAVIEVMRLVDFARDRIPMTMSQDLLVLVSPDDSVVMAAVTKRAFERVDSPRKRLVEVQQTQDPSSHVLAGDILAPDLTDGIANTILEFVSAGQSD